MAILELDDRIELTSFIPDVTAITQSSDGNDIDNFIALNNSNSFTLSADLLDPPVLSDTTNNLVFVEGVNQQTGKRYLITKSSDYSTTYGTDWDEGYYKVHVRQYMKVNNGVSVENGLQDTEYFELTKNPLYWNKSFISFMTYIQPGTFWMGSPVGEYGKAAGETLHRVTITKPFYIARTQISYTFGNRLLNCNGCTPLNYYTIGTTVNGVTTYTKYSESLSIVSKSVEYSTCFANGTATDDYQNYKYAYYGTTGNSPRGYFSYSKYNRGPKSGSNIDNRTGGFGAPGADANHKGFYVVSGVAYPIPYLTGSYMDPEEDRSLFHAFNKKLKVSGYRWDLPTEEQWEYCCRAKTKSAFNNGENLKFKSQLETGVTADSRVANPNIHEICWYAINNGKSHNSGQLKPNNWGLFDCHGNAWEMCKNWYVANNTSHTNGDEPISGSLITGSNSVVIRGGGYSTYAYRCRSAVRVNADPSITDSYYGCRPILVAE